MLPTWAISLLSAGGGLGASELFSWLRERRTHRRHLLLRRHDEQLAALEGLAHAVAAIRRGEKVPDELSFRIQRAFGKDFAWKMTRIVQRLGRGTNVSPGRRIEDTKDFSALFDTFGAMLQDTEKALGVPPLGDARALYEKAHEEEEERWRQAEADIDAAEKALTAEVAKETPP